MEKPSNYDIGMAVHEADLAFWSKIADTFPQAETGDFPPELDVELTTLMNKCVRVWLSYNHPAYEDGE